jgi:hypothetical protein
MCNRRINMSNQLQRVVCVSLATFAAVCLNATATSATWSGANDSAWSNTSNWSANPVPGTGDTATFDNAGSSHVTINLAGGVTVRNLLFDTVNAAAYTIVTLSGKISGNTKVTQSVATFGAPTGKPLTITNDANDFTGQFSAQGAYGAKVYFTSPE